MSTEHRTDRRAAWSGSATLDMQSHFFTCQGMNLSEGGICFAGSWCARGGEVVGMKLQLFDREVRAQGRVVWSRHERGRTTGGIVFTAMAPQSTEILKSYVDGMSDPGR